MARRSGFLTYLLLGAMVVVGVLVFALQNYARQQNRFAHRIAYGQTCESVARSGLTVLSTRFRETFRRSGKLLPLLAALGNTRFGFFVASRPEQITQRFASLGSSSDAIFRALLGPDYRFPLDQLVERYPGMVVELAIQVEGAALYENAGVTDPVEKTVNMTLTAKATWMEVTRRVSTGWQVKVVHPAPPLAAKFTLFTPEAAPNWNTVVNDIDGNPLPGSSQFAILYNTPPEDAGDGLDDAALLAARADPGTVRAALTNRGHIYLGGRTPVSLNMTAGLAGFGEYYQVYRPRDLSKRTLWTRLFSPPPFFNGWRGEAYARDRRYENETHWQYPNMQQVYYGFDQTLAGDPLFGDSMVDEARSSSLHLFGSAAMPSRTHVWGEVYQSMARVGRIGFEAVDKLSNVESAAPVRNGYDGVPYLPYCPDAAAYKADLSTEASGGVPKHLARIRQQFGPGAPGILPAFQLDPGVYTHARMFGETFADAGADGLAVGYAAFMSKIERFPYPEMVDAMQYPPSFPPHTAKVPSVLEQPYAAYRDVSAVELPFTDGLHRQLGQAQYYKGDLAAFFTRPRPDDPCPAETILRARTLREFSSQQDFLAACEWPPGSRNLEVWETVRILEGGLDLPAYTIRGIGHVVVDAGNITSGGLVSRPLPDGLPSLVTFATLKGDVTLAGGARHEAHWMAIEGTVKTAGSGAATVVGGVAARRMDPSCVGGGLVVQFTSAADPTRTDDPQRARYVDYYTVGMGQVPVAVERLP